MKILPRVLTLLLLLNSARVMQAAICSVPGTSYPTIQSAVDDPNCSVVNVAPGVYAENVTINRTVTLNGAHSDQVIATRTSGGTTESILQGVNAAGPSAALMINAPSVIVDGFTIRNSVATSSAFGIIIQSAGFDTSILNNFVDGITSADSGPNGTATGIYLENGPDFVNVKFNAMQNITGPRLAAGVVVGDAATTNLSENTILNNNTLGSITSASGGAFAVRIVKADKVSASLQFINNKITNVSGASFVHALSIECDMVGSVILDNDFTALSSPSGDVVAILFDNDPNAYTAAITGNTFNLTMADWGIKIQGPTTFPPPLIGPCNFWGSPDGPGPVGPGHGARISSGILYWPWKVAPAPDSCIGQSVPTTEAQCKNGGWSTVVRGNGTPFKNQGDCVQYVNTAK